MSNDLNQIIQVVQNVWYSFDIILIQKPLKRFNCNHMIFIELY